MPLPYLALHILLSASAAYLGWRSPARWHGPLGLLALTLVVGGYVLERVPELAWGSMAWGLADLVFLQNVSLEGASLLCAVLARSLGLGGTGPRKKGAAVRAAFLSIVLLGAALWSYSWLYMPLPALSGELDKTGFLEQTSDDSCSAASAAMLLHKYGIEATEKEMCVLCLTRQGMGTPPLGLFRGLAIKGAERGLHPRLVMLRPNEFHKLGKPAIIAVGLRSGTPQRIAARMAEYGWRPGVRHAVTILGAAQDGSWLDVADPTFGREHWPINDMEYIWDDRAVVLMK